MTTGNSYSDGAVSLFFGLNRTLTVGDGGVTFDAFVTEEHSKSIKLTEIPVEDGSIVNDHSVMMPRKLNIRAIKSNTPIFYGGALAKTLISGDLGKIGENNSAIEWQALIEVLEKREPLRIVTVFEVYDSMVLTDIGTVSDKDSSETLIVDMVFQEFRTVSALKEKIQANKIKEEKTSQKASKNQSQGQKPVEYNDTIFKSWTR